MFFPDPIQKKELYNICTKYLIKRLSLFGSAARGDFGADSDIDVLVEFSAGMAPSLGKLVDLQDELTDLFGRKVDIATIAILKNPYRKQSVEKDLRELYAA